MKYAWIALVVAIALVSAWAIWPSSGPTLTGQAIVYKSSTCGCCGIWTNYINDAGLDAKVITMEDVQPKKEELGVPAELESCHTMTIGKYFVEGHIPAEAIAKLMAEQPDIAGIAMPGMPSGSPGMPGAKTGPFVIYAVNHDGSYQEFMRI